MGERVKMNFETLTYEQALRAIPDRTADWLKANAAFYHGDHWQNGEAWTGPRLATTHPLYAETWQAIQKSFVASNKIREFVRRETMAAIGDVPAWALTPKRPLADAEQPTAAEQALIAEATAIFQRWWDARAAHRLLEEATSTAAWAGRGVLRLFVPPGRLVNGMVPQTPVEQAVDCVFAHCPEPQQATVYESVNSRLPAGIYVYEESESEELTDGKMVSRAEVCYVGEAAADGSRLTLLRVMGTDGQDMQEPAVLDLGGRLTIHELRRPVLITEQVRAGQKALNKTLTMMDRNGTQAGFLERIVTNAQLPGHMEPDPNHPGLERFVPEPMHLGPGTTNFLAGVTLTDSNGNQSLATPGVHYRDPVSPATFIETRNALYRQMLEETMQIHVLMALDAGASGESRKQARAEFEQAVRLPAALVEDAMRWLIETILALAGMFAGQPGRYAGLRASVAARVDLGPVSADEIRANTEQVAADLLAPETAMSRNGVRDVPAEMERITTGKAARADLAQQMLEQARRSFDQGSGDNGAQ
jgi:hypothetical protein